MDFNRASGTDNKIGTLVIDCEAECTGTLYTHSGTKLLVDGEKKLEADTLTHTATNSTPKSLIQVDGTLEARTIDLQGGLNVGCNSLAVASSGTVTATNLTWSTNDNYTNTAYPAIDNAGTITLNGNLNATGPASNTGTLKTTGGTLTFKSSVENTGTISATTGDISFAGAVTGAGGTISTTSGNITTSATDASALGTVSTSGVLKNSGTGAVTVKEFSMGADTSVTNSSGGALTISKLTGNHTATLTAGTNAITVSAFDGSPTIEAASGAASLGGGTIAALTVNTGAETAVAGNLTVTGATTNAGTISVGANSITFAGAVSSASGTVAMTTGGVTVSGAAASDFGTVQCAGGAFTNSGSAATTVADFAMTGNSVITNSAGGTLTLTKLSGAYNATIKSVSADNGMTINCYDAATKIAVAASSKNILLAGGTLDSLVINGGAKTTISGDITTTSGITNSGTLATSASLAINGAVTNGGTIEAAANDITFNGATVNAGTITATSGAVTFAGAVTGASGTIITTTGNITTSAADASSLGTVQSSGGTISNSGSGAATIAELQMGAATSVTNSTGGALTITKLSGNSAATLTGGTNAITVSSYDASPTIEVAAGTSSLGAGTIAALTVDASAETTILGDIETSGGITNAGTLDASAAKITMTGASVTLTGNTTAANTNIKDFVYAPTDTTGTGLAVVGSNTFTNFTCSTDGAKIAVNAANNFGTFSATGSGSNITLSGANTIETLSVKSAGGTLVVDAAQTVTTLALAGTNATHRLNVTGAGSIALASNQNSGNYLNVAYTGVSIDGKYYSAKNSTFDAAPYYGQQNHWILLNNAMEFVWTGATDTDWGKPSNWNYNLIPGTELEYEGVNTKTYPVTIPNSPSSGRYPEASAGYTIKSLQIGTSEGSSASLTLHSGSTYHNITITGTLSGALENHGTIFYSGSDRITKSDKKTFINDTAHKGTVVFNSADGATDLAGTVDSGTTPPTLTPVSYYNLTISGTGTYIASAALNVANALTVSAGNASFNDATSAKTATITTTGTLALGDGTGDSFTVTDGALELSATLGGLTLAGTITAGGTGISLGHNATLAADTTFASATKTDAPVKLTGEFTVKNTDTLTTSSTNTLTLENASLVNTGSAANGYIVFEGTAAQTFTPNAAAYSKITVNKTSGAITVSQALETANLTITQSGSSTFNGKVTVIAAYSDTTTAGNIAFNAGCSFTPAATFLTNGTLTLNGSAPACEFTNGLVHENGATKIKGAINTTNSAITLAATMLDYDTTIDAGTGTVKLGAISGEKELTFKNGGTLELTGTVAASKITMTGAEPTLTGNGTTIPNFVYDPESTTGAGLKVSDGNTFTVFSCATDGAKITLSGANSFGSLAMTSGGGTLVVDAAQTVTTLALAGTSETNPLTITNAGNAGSITIATNQHTGNFLNIDPDKVSINTGYYIADNSKFINSTQIYGQRNHWILMNKAMAFEWTADAASEDWGTPGNWNYNLVPGLANATGGVSTKGYPALISNAPVKAYMPATGAVSYSVGQLTINDATSSIRIFSASLAIETQAGVSDTADGTLTNKGTIFYKSTGRITNGTAFINDASNGGTVDFAGTESAADLAAVQYHNLIVSGSGTYTAAAALTVLNDLTISGTGTFAASGDATITGAIAASAGNVFFNNGAGNSATSAATAAFGTTGTVSLGNTSGDSFTVTGALALPHTLGGLTLAGTITASGGITLSKDAALAEDTTFASATSLGAAVTISGSHLVTTKAALDTSAAALTLNDASLTNAAAVTNGNIIFTESAASAQTFTPFSSTYDNVTVNKTSGGSWTLAAALTATDCQISSNGTTAINAALSASSCQITNSGTMTFAAAAPFSAGSLTLSNNGELSFNAGATVSSAFTDTSASGNIHFNAGCSFTPQATFSTSGTLTLDGSTTACAFDGGLKHTAGTTILYGALNTSNKNIELGTTTLAADTTINAGTGTPPGTVKFGALDGTYTLTSSGTGLVTFGGAVGGTTQPTSITITGPAAINAATNVNGPITVNGKTTVSGPSITTPTDPATGLQLYKDDITFSVACSVTGTIQAAAGIKTSAAVTAIFINNVWLYSSAAASLGGTGGSLDITGDLYFVGESKNASVDSNVTAQNVLLLHGTVDIGSSATLASSTGDVILLGAAYDIKDNKDGAAASGVENLFAYNHSSRKKLASYRYSTTDEFPPACPDGTTPISSIWSGAVTTNAGAKISAGQNFYANGLSSLGSGAWTLLLKENDRQDSAFAEVYNSTITNCTASPIGGSVYLAAAENNTVSGCSANVVTSRPVIAEAWTVYDDVVYVSFKETITGNPVAIENSCNEISAAAAQISYYGGSFVSTWTDADCSTSTNGADDLSSFYIKAGSTWNTDAFEISAGAAQSTDRGRGSPYAKPEHRTAIPCLNLPKALTNLYESLRDKSKNRIAHYYNGSTPDVSAVNAAPGKAYTKVADKCAPVLIQVLTGQEAHQEPSVQKDCDAHNFVEFVYSEPVDIASVSGSTSVAQGAVNVQAAADLGATTNNAAGMTFAGLASSSSGSVNAALKSGSGSPHSLYRNFSDTVGAAPVDHAARVRLSIAGYVDGTISSGGVSYKNWTGYISSAATPAGTIARIANDNIKDKSPAQNSLAVDSPSNHQLPAITVQNSGAANELYGTWDVTPPSFAPLRINGTTNWAAPAYDGSQEFEFVGASYSTGTLASIEMHFFDNQPTYDENYQWFSRAGWGPAGSATEYASISNFAADVRGGSRPDAASNATLGGIRYCSLYNAHDSFKYSVLDSGTYNNFTQDIKGGAGSSLFTYAGTDPGAAPHTTGAEDGLYCKLMLDDTSLHPNTTFLMQFDSNTCFITDLAGNRIQCGKITMKSVDRTQPEFLMTAVPLGTKQMLVIFSKALNIDVMTLYDSPSSYTKVQALEWIPKGLELTTASGTGIEIDKNIPATCLFRNNKSTGIVVTLTKDAVLSDVINNVQVTVVGFNKYDPLPGIDATITYIQDPIGNYVIPNKTHAFSDFAVNAVMPQYIYDNTLTDGGVSTDYSLYKEGMWAVRDWNAEQQNYGTLSAGKEYILQTALYDGTSDKSGGLDPATGQLKSGTIKAFFDAAPDAVSVSTKINENTKLSWRIWHPNFTSDIFSSLAPANDVPQFSVDGTANDSGVVFDIPQKVSSEKWKNGDQVSFLFKLGDYTVDHFGDGTNYPLYAIRLKDLNDITSLDLWSFKIRTTNLQRGGVSILNNVIDLNNGEHTVIQVDMKESGNLNVMVMTLDGNIVTYLRHGYTDAGTHYYNWNGTNNGGSKVARGLYFVRVIGPGIDETRKVMCVK